MVRTWLYDEPLPFFKEVRAERPILEMPNLTLATRYNDCQTILTRPDAFGVDLYVPKQGGYWMSQDDTPAHWREKAIVRSILDPEDIPAMRASIGKSAADILSAAGGTLEVVQNLTRAVPVIMVQDWFGYDKIVDAGMREWSYWNQEDAFHNQPFDNQPDPTSITRNRELHTAGMVAYLVALIGARSIEVKAGSTKTDSVTRLLKLSFSGALKFDLQKVISNVGGLLIGSVETTSHCVVNALAGLLSDPGRLAAAVAVVDDPAKFDGYVYEQLRFTPAFPYFFRTCHIPTPLSGDTPLGRTIAPGTTVLAVSQSAMFDETVVPDPERFDPTRPQENGFVFGKGPHECLGIKIGEVIIPEIVRQCLKLPGIHQVGLPVRGVGAVPSSYQLAWTV